MLEEYILNQLEENEKKISKLKDELEEYLQEESKSKERLAEYDLSNRDTLDLFSPRMINDDYYQEKLQIEEQIDKIQLKKLEIENQINKIKRSSDEYQKMLLETRKEDKEEQDSFSQMSLQIMDESESIAMIKKQNAEEYKIILKRIDNILNLLGTNKTQCKNELTNLKYYLKTLISSQMIDQ